VDVQLHLVTAGRLHHLACLDMAVQMVRQALTKAQGEAAFW
jgi:hypothetical protein